MGVHFLRANVRVTACRRNGAVSVHVEDCASVVVAVHAEMGMAMKMTKERLAGAIKVGFAQGRVDYTETVYDDLICLETEGELRSFRKRAR